MHATAWYLPDGADHAEERLYRRKLDDALFDATVHRLETSHARLGLLPATDAEILPLRRHIRTLIARLEALKFTTAAYHEMSLHEAERGRTLHARVLELADFAANLASRLGFPGDDIGLLCEIENDLADFDRLIDGYLRSPESPSHPVGPRRPMLPASNTDDPSRRPEA